MTDMDNDGFITPDDATEATASLDENSGIVSPTKETKPFGEFESAEALLKGYQALESKLGSNEGETPTLELKAPETGSVLTAEDLAGFATQMAEDPEATYKALEARGISKDLADRFIANERLAADTRDKELLSTVGGNEAFEKMSQWALDGGFSETEQAAFNEALQSTNPDIAKMAMRSLAANYRDSVGETPDFLTGTSNATAGSKGYRSYAEYAEDLHNPKYKTDPAFREDSWARLAASDESVMDINQGNI